MGHCRLAGLRRRTRPVTLACRHTEAAGRPARPLLSMLLGLACGRAGMQSLSRNPESHQPAESARRTGHLGQSREGRGRRRSPAGESALGNR